MEIRELEIGDEEAYWQFRRDFLEHDIENPYSEDIRRGFQEAPENFVAVLEQERGMLHPEREDWVPAIHYHLFTDEHQIAGRVTLRLGMTEALSKSGGNIGYGVAPSFRRQGVAREMLNFALEKFRVRAESYVVLTANANNLVSRHLIESSGGKIFETEDIEHTDNRKEKTVVYHIELVR